MRRIRNIALLAALVAVAVAVGCGPLVELFGYPPEALRRSAPEGIDKQAQSPTSPAPEVALPGAPAPVKTTEAGRYLLVFYRGHW